MVDLSVLRAIVASKPTLSGQAETPSAPIGKSRTAIYATLLFYTVGVFVASYVLGGQSLSYEDKAIDVAAFQTQAGFYKEQTRLHKLEYAKLANTPPGAVPACGACGQCDPPTRCDADGCPTCPSTDVLGGSLDPSGVREESNTRRMLLDAPDVCPPCPPCSGESSTTTCEKDSLLKELAQIEKSLAAAEQVKADIKPYNKKTEEKLTEATEKYQAIKLTQDNLIDCLKTAMPATGKAYEESLKLRSGKA
mmetsp:Transcript_35748/g.78023  ORF Transcript_35748/g.78023 Transcript_35748/m.78023 type:complete len:250 (+) Transcript_35748:256-1005(+)|eukprot:CAMPEP_0118923060 /NCGR_PEP_ID=MMETSP1169-20130426/1736_1 /TAXON_ID=36882 /ORGANISM="Pyramimonas obovata, Strain CCMP722" /LENGTH=249 /DNA_ID=CAMNT_0006864001 /DNA_START=256 /DNA_END=1005 /DNA_ORIENTATION=+